MPQRVLAIIEHPDIDIYRYLSEFQTYQMSMTSVIVFPPYNLCYKTKFFLTAGELELLGMY